MPGIGLPAGGIRSTPGRAVSWGGVGILVVTLAFAVARWPQASTSFDRPVEVDATVVEDGFASSGGVPPTCRPLFSYQVGAATYTARPPTRDSDSCASVGDTVRIVVDSQDPERIANPVGERSVSFSLVTALVVGGVMTAAGAALRVRERRRSS